MLRRPPTRLNDTLECSSRIPCIDGEVKRARIRAWEAARARCIGTGAAVEPRVRMSSRSVNTVPAAQSPASVRGSQRRREAVAGQDPS